MQDIRYSPDRVLTRTGEPIRRFGLSFDVVNTPGTFNIKASSFLLINSGTTTAMIGKSLTISPGQNFSMSMDHWNELFYQKISITFTGAGSNRLEIVQTLSDSPEIENYTGHQTR